MLANKKKSVWLLKPLFELRLLTMAGFMPDLTGCDKCGEFKAPDGAYFSLETGTFICKSCLDAEHIEQLGETVYIAPAILAAMR